MSLQLAVRRITRLVDRPADLELLERFREGDEAAFAEIMRRHGGVVRGVCRRVLGDGPAADDAWQATFLLLARRASSLTGRGSLAGWLHGVARRMALNERRARRRRQAHEARAAVRDEPSPDKQAAWRELQELVDAAVGELPDPLREVFVRCCLQSAGCHEVARELRINEGTVRSRLMRARRRVADRLARHGVCLSTALTLVAAGDTAIAATLRESTLALAVGRSTDVPTAVAALINDAGRTWTISVAATVVAVIVAVGFAQVPPKKVSPASPPPVVKDAAAEPVAATTLPAGAVARFGSTNFRTAEQIQGLAFDPTGKTIVSVGNAMYRSDQIHVWNATTGEKVRALNIAERTLFAAAWPGEGRGWLITNEGDQFGGNVNQLSRLRLSTFDRDAGPPVPEPGKPGPAVGIARPADGSPTASAIAFSADGKRLAVVTASAGNPSDVLILVPEEGKTLVELKSIAKFEGTKDGCWSLAFSPDGKRLVGLIPTSKDNKTNDGGALTVWDANGKILRRIELPVPASQGYRMALAASNAHAAVGLEDGDVAVVELATGKVETIATKHVSAAGKGRGFGTFAVGLSPDGKLLASAGRDGMVRISDPATATVLRSFGRHASWPESMAFSRDGTRLATAGQDGVIRVWDPATGKDAVPTGGNSYGLWRTLVSADGQSVVTDSRDDVLRVWNADGRERCRIDTPHGITDCGLSPDSKHLLAVTGNGDKNAARLQVWDLQTGKETTPASFPASLPGGGFRFAPDGKSLVLYTLGKASAWSWPEGNPVWAVDFPAPTKSPGVCQVDSLSFLPDGRHFVVVGHRSWHREEKGLKFGYGSDGIVDVFDARTGRHVRRLVEAESCFRAGAALADGMFLHTGGGRLVNDGPAGELRGMNVIDPLTGRWVRAFGSPEQGTGMNSGIALSVSADGKMLFRPNESGEVEVYEVATGGLRRTLAGHVGMVLSVDAPADVRRVVSGGKDTSALLWDIGFGGKPSKLDADATAKAWEGMTDPDGVKAFVAMTALAGDPAAFVAQARKKVPVAAAGPTKEELDPLFRDLDSKVFARREAAAGKLEKYGEGAVGLVRERLETETSNEVRDRLQRFLVKMDGPDSLSMRLTQIRVVELLEHLRTAEAKALLTDLAKGGPSRLTTDAAAAAKRVQ